MRSLQLFRSGLALADHGSPRNGPILLLWKGQSATRRGGSRRSCVRKALSKEKAGREGPA
jgi:hypothetical protein